MYTWVAMRVDGGDGTATDGGAVLDASQYKYLHGK